MILTLLSVLVLSATAFASEGGEGGLLSINVGLAFWTTLTFILLMVVLRLFAWKPILKGLQKREDTIKDSLEAAEKAKREAEELIEKNRQDMQKAEDEAQKVIAQSKEYADKLKNQMLDESREEAKKIIDNATAEIERKKQEAFNEIKDQVANISLEIAGKLLREELDKKKHNDIINKFIDDMRKN